MIYRILLFCFYFTIALLHKSSAQQIDQSADDNIFFLAKKKGLLGKLGRSISTTPPDETPQKVENQFLKFKGKIIRNIDVVRLGFQQNFYDTNIVKYNLGIRLANVMHKNTKERVIRNNLFFTEGGRLFPFLFADNERYLRSLSFIQDARIIVEFSENSKDSVDVQIITKDIFSLGIKLKVENTTYGRVELEEDNIAGSATKLMFSGFYDLERKPQKAFAGEITRRNIGGSFIDWTAGASTFSPSFTSGRREELKIYNKFEKPLVTPFFPVTGSLEAGYYQSANTYAADTLYKNDLKYAYYNIDGWIGYSLDNRRALYNNREIRVHNFISFRAFRQHFTVIPLKYSTFFDQAFTNNTGALASINIFKQVFYKTNFIYGFGRNEDVPEGFSAVLTGGYAIQQNKAYAQSLSVKRPYSGLDFTLTNFRRNGFYTNYTFRSGGYFFRKRFEDVNLLFNVEHFTRLKKINRNWYWRFFSNTGITAQINRVFNQPLLINSFFGLPYFNNENTRSDFRTTIKMESVFYNTKKILGFRFAPFIFTDLIFLKQPVQSLQKTDLYSALGCGIRTRNENLVFGTIELRGFYFPKAVSGMDGFKLQISSNIRFRYNSTFIKRPDVVLAN